MIKKRRDFVRKERNWTASELAQIEMNRVDVLCRRSALGLSQRQLNEITPIPERFIERIERRQLRSGAVAPEHPFLSVVKDTLSSLEKDPNLIPEKFRYQSRAESTGVVRSRNRPSTTQANYDPLVVRATLKRCKENDVWITQGGCVGRRRVDPICQTRSGGKQCGGVRYRRLETKEIEVPRTPPKAGDMFPPRRYRTKGE